MLRLGMPKAIYYLNLFTQSQRNLDNFEVKGNTTSFLRNFFFLTMRENGTEINECLEYT